MENEIIVPKLMDIDELLENNYIIPLYQREYSWEKDNIYKLINSIKNEQNLYLGNILVESSEKSKNRIIDGQQRITTLLLILYYLDNKEYSKINKKITIESENENKKFNQLFEEKKEFIIESIDKELKSVNEKKRKQKENDLREKNIYLLNFYYISQFLGEIKDARKLLSHILEDIKIVRITINTSEDNEKNLDMSKIFDTINTTGKPLEAKDKFKVRIYNLNNSDRKSNGKRIEKIYATINKCNNNMRKLDEKAAENLFKKYSQENPRSKIDNFIKYDSERYDVEYFLRLYQFFLCILKNKEGNDDNDNYSINKLIKMNYETFFDRLFDILDENKNEEIEKNYINIYDEEDSEVDEENYSENDFSILENRKSFKIFNQNKDNIIKVSEIEEFFKVLQDYKEYIVNKINWEKDVDAYFLYKIFKNYNRYSWTYGYLPILYFYVYKDNPNFSENFFKFIKYISKLCALYSILYSKQIYDCRIILIEEMKKIISKKPIKDYTNQLKKRVNDIINKKAKELDNILLQNITETNYRKNIICLILAKNAEMKSTKKACKRYDRINNLFSIRFDIEHIYASAKNDKEKNKLEPDELNGIGNLMILEHSYNESIGSNDIYKKIEKYKISSFEIVRNFSKEYNEKYKNDDNFIKDIKNRKETCIDELKKFFR